MKLYYKSFGSGKPLVILHGLFGSSDNWQSFAKIISTHYQVITLDIRNHGNSEHTDDFSLELIDVDLIDTLGELGISNYYLMGHSMGGKAAAFHALHHPHRVDKLIVIDISPKAYAPHHDLYFKIMRSMDFDQISSRTQADLWMQDEINDPIIRQFLLKNLVRDDRARFEWKFNLEALYKNYYKINEELKSDYPFNNPTLFIKGEHSDYIKNSDYGLIHALFNAAEIITIDGAGHWVHADQPMKLKEVVIYFLSN